MQAKLYEYGFAFGFSAAGVSSSIEKNYSEVLESSLRPCASAEEQLAKKSSAKEMFTNGWERGVTKACEFDALAAEIHRAILHPKTLLGFSCGLLRDAISELVMLDNAERKEVGERYLWRYKKWHIEEKRFVKAIYSNEKRLVYSLLRGDEEKAKNLIINGKKFGILEFLWLRRIVKPATTYNGICQTPSIEKNKTLGKAIVALSTGDFITADAHLLHHLINSHLPLFNRLTKSRSALYDQLEEIADDWRGESAQAFKNRFSETFDQNLEQLIREVVEEGPRLNYLLSLLSGDEREITVNKLRLAVFGFSEQWSGSFFLGKSQEERRQIEESYNYFYPEEPLRGAVLEHFKGLELEILNEVIESGRFSLGKLCYACVAGIGTDEKGLKWIFENAEPEELSHISEQFASVWQKHAPWYERIFPKYFQDFEHRIWLECGGDSWFDFRGFLSERTTPGTVSEKMTSLREHERSGRLIKRLDFLSHEGRIMDESIDRIRAFQQQDSNPTFFSNLILKKLISHAELNVEIFRNFKHAAGNFISAVVVGLPTGAVTLALLLRGIPLETVMLLIGSLSTLGRSTVKVLIKGRSYTFDEFLLDAFFGAIDGVTLFVSRIFREAAFRSGAKVFARVAAKNARLIFSTNSRARRPAA